jgi:type II secretory pathway predicted ATPase ExeA
MSGSGGLRAAWRWLVNEPERTAALPQPPPYIVAQDGEPEAAETAPVQPAAPAEREGPSGLSALFASALTRTSDRARISAAFNAAQPVGDRFELLGRGEELSRLVTGVAERHKHAVIFGPRGSGKTSLARVFGDLADEANCVALYQAASGDASFAELMRPFGALVSEALDLPGGQGISLPPGEFSARDFAMAIAPRLHQRVLMIIDEFDRVENFETKTHLASLMKLLSDTHSPAQMVLVGIAADVDQLIEAHPSLRRHLVTIAVGPFDSRAANAIIDEGVRRCGVPFDDAARDVIISVAQGSPYHIRLLCLNAALAAACREEPAVGRKAAMAGMRAAYEEWREVNAPTALLFDKVSARPALHEPALRLAATAGTWQVLNERESDATAAAMELLAPALVRGGAGGHLFADSLAPQFLTMAIVLALEGAAEDAGLCQGGTVP